MGYVHLYYGDGKGKTTAALGLAFRASGWGKRSLIIQFMKKWEYGEYQAAKENPLIEVRQFGIRRFIRKGERPPELLEEISKAMALAREGAESGKYDIIVLDEAAVAVYFGVLDEDDLLDFIDAYRDKVEIVITGRKASPRLIEKANLVTEMRKVKHYYDSGVTAREGIEY